MARVTVEDCLEHTENRFSLIITAAKRARQLELSALDSKVPEKNDKPTVLALREIAEGYDVEKIQPVNAVEAEFKVMAAHNTDGQTSEETYETAQASAVSKKDGENDNDFD